jgi:hypothetical protein
MIGYIYQITNKINDMIYIGSTCQNLKKRMSQHRAHYNSWKIGKSHFYYLFDIFDEVGTENCNIELIMEITCNDRNYIRKRERDFYDILPNSNKNKPYIYKHEYTHYFKEWRKLHKGYMKEWEEKHKGYFEKYRQQNTKSVQCKCGSIVTSINGNLNKHYKTKKHIQFMNVPL